MKIAIIYPIFEPAIPPALQNSVSSFTVITNHLATRLAKQHEVMVISRGSADLPERIESDGVTYRYITRNLKLEDNLNRGFRVLERLTDYRFSRDPFFTRRSYYRLYARQAGKIAKEWGADVLHLLIFFSMAPTLHAQHPQAKLVLHMQNEWLTQISAPRVRRSLPSIERILACSDFVANRIKAAYPEYRDKVFTLYNGVDTSHFKPVQRPPRQKPRILFVGRLSAEKGAHILIRAFEAVAARYPDAELDIVGPAVSPAYEFMMAVEPDPNVQALRPFFTRWLKRGDAYYLEKLKAMIPPALQSRIHLHGGRPNHELRSFFETASVFVFPPVWHEPFGIPVIEAMASGVPVVTTRSGGIMELVEHEETGLLVERGDVEGLASAVLRLLDEPSLADRLITQARERTRDVFTWDQVAQDLSDIHYAALRSTP